ncbi:hypothetical protein I317_02825 [Kwoniella heveanensis CBS 569]|nr:hypothetical protein I317_02825 [Kwoniella heveanensis CBS 569]
MSRHTATRLIQLSLPLCPAPRCSVARSVLYLASPRHTPVPPRLDIGIRRYATHKSNSSFASGSGAGPGHTPSADATSDLLKGASSAGRATEGTESVGPFPLGVGASGRSKTWKSWKELGIGGKLVRTTQQTGNLTVILFGGALFVILTFALTTELFAKNSPSVLYSQAVDMIRASDALNPHLLPPLTFTHSPHSSAPVRGSAPIPHTFVKNPKTNRDHMLLTFWVHGRGKDEPENLGWLKSAWRSVEDYGRQGLAFMIGRKQAQAQEQQQQQEQGTLARLFGGFTSSLRSTSSAVKKGMSGSGRGLPPPGTYKIGEVRAEYVKNASGQFTLLSLFVDVPASNASYPGRAVIYQSPEAATEGLLGTRIR